MSRKSKLNKKIGKLNHRIECLRDSAEYIAKISKDPSGPITLHEGGHICRTMDHLIKNLSQQVHAYKIEINELYVEKNDGEEK